MPLMIEETTSNFKPIPPGMHQARCYMVLDLGTQIDTFQGEQKANRKVMFTWELAELMDDGKPFAISKEYSFYLSDQAKLRKDLVSWRGREFTPEELKGFDLFSVLNANCLLNIVHKTSASGKTRSDIASIAPLVKGMPKLDPVNEAKTLNLSPEEYDMELFDSLPNWIKDKVKKSPEWLALEVGTPESHTEDYHQVDDMPPMTEDIPF